MLDPSTLMRVVGPASTRGLPRPTNSKAPVANNRSTVRITDRLQCNLRFNGNSFYDCLKASWLAQIRFGFSRIRQKHTSYLIMGWSRMCKLPVNSETDRTVLRTLTGMPLAGELLRLTGRRIKAPANPLKT